MQARSEEAFREVARWREAHPKATLAQMIEDVAQASSPEPTSSATS